jgi:hypothetical protein
MAFRVESRLTRMTHLGQAAVPVLQPRLKMLELERMKFTAFSRR